MQDQVMYIKDLWNEYKIVSRDGKHYLFNKEGIKLDVYNSLQDAIQIVLKAMGRDKE